MRRNPDVKVEYNKIPTIERIPEKQLYRPYFSSERGGWEIDFAFHICDDKQKSETEENVVDTWLFCVNVNTRYLEVYKCPRKDTKSVIESLHKLTTTHFVSSIRGDGESAFKSVSEYVKLKQEIKTLVNVRNAIPPQERYGQKWSQIIYALDDKAKVIERKRKELKSQPLVDKLNEIADKNVTFMWMNSPFTNHNRIVDCAIKTIRNAIGYREINENQLLQIVNYYNNTYHRSIDCTPNDMENNSDIEYQYIRWNEQKLDYVLSLQDSYGLTKYEKGNILLVHLDKGKTKNKFEKRRTYYDRLGEFQNYENGNVKIKLLSPVMVGTKYVNEAVVPAYHTQFLAKNKESIPKEYINSYIVKVGAN